MAVGSSGGHIYPAIAIAENLEEQLQKLQVLYLKNTNSPQYQLKKLQQRSKLKPKNSVEIHFVHSGSSLGKNILNSFPYPSHEISIGGGLAKGQNFWKKIKTLLLIPKAFLQTFFLIKKLKAEVVLGTGGAITGPVLLMACLMRKKTAIWEGNALMGLANKWLSPFVSCIFTVFPLPSRLSQKKQILCAYPLRPSLYKTNSQEAFSNHKIPKVSQTSGDIGPIPGIPSNHKTLKEKYLFKVLILGGSQGSVFLNQVVSEAVQEELWRKNIFIYHQTGEKHFPQLKEKYKSLKNLKPFPFSLKIEEYYKKCDLIFSRAGSGAIWEAAFYKKALVLIPLTSSAGGHQLQNASKLCSQNCVEMILEKDFNGESFKEKLLQLKKNKEKREEMAQSLYKSCTGEGGRQIADWLFSHIT